MYQIGFEETTRNPIYLAIHEAEMKYDISLSKIIQLSRFSVQLLISKEIGSRQNHLWLETSSKQVDHKGFFKLNYFRSMRFPFSSGCNHFHVDISLQDVDTTHRRTYPHSSVQSKEFYDSKRIFSFLFHWKCIEYLVALSTGIQEVFSTEENHLQQSMIFFVCHSNTIRYILDDGMESVASGKRRYDQIDTLGLWVSRRYFLQIIFYFNLLDDYPWPRSQEQAKTNLMNI